MYTTNTHWSSLILVSQQYSKARTEYNGTIHDESGAGVHVASTQTRSSKLKLSLVFTGWLSATTRCSLDTVCDAPSILFVLPVSPPSSRPPVFPVSPPVFSAPPPVSPSPPVFPTLPGPGECQDEGGHTNRVLLQHTLPPSPAPRPGTMASAHRH